MDGFIRLKRSLALHPKKLIMRIFCSSILVRECSAFGRIQTDFHIVLYGLQVKCYRFHIAQFAELQSDRI